MSNVYSKSNLLVDIDTIVHAFRAILYALRVTFTSQKELGLPLGRIDVDSKGVTDSCIIHGSEFIGDISSPESLTFLMNHCGAFARANLLIACHERVKGYCFNSTPANRKAFESKEQHDHSSALYLMKCLRDAATHWKPINAIDYKPWFGPALQSSGIAVKAGMLENELLVSNKKLLVLVSQLRAFVVEVLE